VQITPDIIQVPLPLPFALRIVNCYLLRGSHGWTVVDSGLGTADDRDAWLAAFAENGIGPGDLEQIVLTHFHPDHYGLAGWLQQWNGADTPVYMAPREAEQARIVWQRPEGSHEPMHDLFTNYGAPPDLANAMVEQLRNLRRHTAPHPAVTLLEPGSEIRLGRRDCRVIHAPGHSDGQVVFYDPADRLMLSGDQVLIKITPNIGLWPESEPDPLGRYLGSLEYLATLDVRLALPGHGALINDWRGRLAELQHHHAERLNTMFSVVNAATDAYTVACAAFPFERLTHHEMRFAMAETIAHLEYMLHRGQLQKSFDAIWKYSRV
jgi:glyoxylase-like metal-dependent hydrolase (beta-lactamase superfamily II)